MDYRNLIGKECACPEGMAGEAAEKIQELQEFWEKRTDPNKVYTIEDFRALPEGFRAELVDGKLIFLESPTTFHQEIVGEMYYAAATFIKANRGGCKAFVAPFDVYLKEDETRVLEPDLVVVCDRDKLGERGCHGAPDWIVEVASPSTRKRDLGQKLFLYREAGVREYWMINPADRTVIVYVFEMGEDASFYSFDDVIESHVLPGLKIRLSDTV